MARIVILGAGISGHTAALTLRHKLSKKHEVVVISPNSNYQWVPSNVWVGVGTMTAKQVIFALEPVYRKLGIIFKQALATEIHPEGNTQSTKPYVVIQYVKGDGKQPTEQVEYDYLINATGPKLDFEATEGLGPHKNSCSICTYQHANEAWSKLSACLSKMEKGEPQRFVIGMGAGNATCQGAAFEYALNVSFEISKRKLMDRASIVWLSNEQHLGDFGMGGAFVKQGGYVIPTKILAESLLKEYGVGWIMGSAVKKVEASTIHYETLDGEMHTLGFDFAMLIPPFAGVKLGAFDRKGDDITAKLFVPSGLMRVDADYTPKQPSEWKAADWPSTYVNPTYDNIFACGISFAPPHPLSMPHTTKNGTNITPAPPRTGMPSGVMGKVVAQNIAHQIKTGRKELNHKASMAKMGAACIISSGTGLKRGKAATLTVFPVVQDWEKYPKYGRNINNTIGEIGLAGHWLKLFMHYMFIYKAKALPLWWIIPE